MTITPIKVSTPREILGTIPVMLGFHPEESLVVVGLAGPRLQVGPVARVDLPIGPAAIRSLGETLTRHVTHAIVVIYGDGEVAETDLHNLGLQILDVIRTTNTEQMVHAPVAEASALSGRAVLRDRTALRRSVEHRPGTCTEQTRQTIRTATSTIEGRGKFLCDRITDAASAVVELIAAAQSMDDSDPGTADWCAVLALMAYRAGDGALGQVAIDRALRVDPDHRLAHLALDVLSAGLKPAELDQVFVA